MTSQTKNKTKKRQKASTPDIFSYPFSNIMTNNFLLCTAGYYEVF